MFELIRLCLGALRDMGHALAAMGEWPFEGEPDVWGDEDE